MTIDNTPERRHCLYNIWHSKDHKIHKLVRQELYRKNRNIIGEDDGNTNGTDEVSVLKENNLHLLANPSLPLPKRPMTRAKKGHIDNGDDAELSTNSETSFILTPIEWKTVFSRSQQKLNDEWRNILSKKLSSCGITCSVRFVKAHVKEGERKQQCKYFWCRAKCTGECCERSYLIRLKDQVDLNTSAIFHVKISGKENHNAKVETMRRQLTGEERYRVGKKL